MDLEDFYCNQVLSGETQVDKVSETAEILAFHHTNPSYETHVVVIPKEHMLSLREVRDYELISQIFQVIVEVVQKLNLESYRIISNAGEYQDSKHLHFHLVSGNKL